MRRSGRGDGDYLPLRDYIDHIQAELQGEIDRRIASLESTATATATALEKRLDGMNEFRDSLNDMTNRMCPRDVFDQHVTTTSSRFSAIESRLTSMEASGRSEETSRVDSRSVVNNRLAGIAIAATILVVVVNVLIDIYLRK